MSADDVTARLNALIDGPDPQRVALRRTADAMRTVIHQMVGSTAPTELLDDVRSRLEEIEALLAQHPAHRAYVFAEASLAGDPSAFFDNSPVAGLANPLAAPVRMRVEGDLVIGDVEWNGAYEGPPGCCHGGHIAAAFDDVLGLAQDLGGMSGMTGTLTIKYRRPTPLNTPHRMVGRLDRTEGRKIFTTGELYHPDGSVLAEAEAVFISVDFAQIRAATEGS